MTCPKCKNRNPIGHKFCHECGSKLPEPKGKLAEEEANRAESERRAERASLLVADAFQLSEQKRFEEAIPLAEEAAELLPTLTTAHALLASLYEQSEQNDKAIAAMEKVVELNPNSTADAYKLEQLKKGVHVLPKREPIKAVLVKKTDRKRTMMDWIPLGVAGLAACLTLYLGITRLGANPTPKPQPSPNPSPSPTVNLPAGFQAIPPPAVRDYNPPPTVRSDPFTPLPGRERSETPSTTPRTSPAAAERLASLTRPNVGRLTSEPSRQVAPAPVAFGSGNGSLPSLTAVPNESAERISAGPPGSDGGNGDTGGAERINAGPPTAENNPSNNGNNGRGTGYIRIQVGPPSGRSNPPSGTGNGERINAGPPAATSDLDADPLRRAQTLQGMGRYEDAVGAYKDALSSGASSAEAHQGIATSQQRLGDKAQAKATYRKAIAAYEAQIAAGKNVARAKQGIETCKAALEALGD